MRTEHFIDNEVRSVVLSRFLKAENFGSRGIHHRITTVTNSNNSHIPYLLFLPSFPVSCISPSSFLFLFVFGGHVTQTARLTFIRKYIRSAEFMFVLIRWLNKKL